LLERNANLPAELRLRYPAILADHSDITTNLHVDDIGATTFPHGCLPLVIRMYRIAQVEANANTSKSGVPGMAKEAQRPSHRQLSTSANSTSSFAGTNRQAPT
jgi:hypothetical protein